MFSNQLHPITHQIDTSKIRLWLHNNYQRHLSESGSVDAEAIAEQAAFELGVDRELAEDVAEIFASEYNRGV